MKLSGRAGNKLDICWVGNATLAFATGEKDLRMWDLASEENFVLKLNSDKGYPQGNSNIICVSYAPLSNIIAAGTSGGHVAMWRPARRENDEEPEKRWRLQAPAALQGGPIEMLQWSPAHGLLGVGTKDEVFILREQIMRYAHCDKVKNENLKKNFSQSFAKMKKKQIILGFFAKIFENFGKLSEKQKKFDLFFFLFYSILFYLVCRNTNWNK